MKNRARSLLLSLPTCFTLACGDMPENLDVEVDDLEAEEFAAQDGPPTLTTTQHSASGTAAQTDLLLCSGDRVAADLVAIALLIMVMIVRDVLADATTKSETDALSGLMNADTFRREPACRPWRGKPAWRWRRSASPC